MVHVERLLINIVDNVGSIERAEEVWIDMGRDTLPCVLGILIME